MRWLDGIIDSMHMSLGELREMVIESERVSLKAWLVYLILTILQMVIAAMKLKDAYSLKEKL